MNDNTKKFPELVEAYRTSDGKLFQAAGHAAAHQQRLTLKGQLTIFWERHYCHGLRSDDLVEICIENLDELRVVLRGLDITRANE
jgi:hypothetical protein